MCKYIKYIVIRSIATSLFISIYLISSKMWGRYSFPLSSLAQGWSLHMLFTEEAQVKHRCSLCEQLHSSLPGLQESRAVLLILKHQPSIYRACHTGSKFFLISGTWSFLSL